MMEPLSELDLKRVELIERFFRTVRKPGELIEIRSWYDESTGIKRTDSGLFNNMRKAAIAAIRLNNEGQHTYFTLNPVNPESPYAKKRTLNKVIRRAYFTTGDNHLTCRRLYLLDFDPDRPGFKKFCSTDVEKVEAWVQAQAAMKYLSGLDWPDPIICDSGNGWHLYYLADDCAVGKEATENVKDALRYLQTLYPYLDTTVKNPARVSRVPHTVNRKNVSSTERPHRRAKLISYPEKFEPVMAGKVYQLAIKAGILTDDDGNRVKTSAAKGESTLLIDEAGVEELIDEFPDQLELTRKTQAGDITYFALASCPFKGAPHRGQDVGAGKTTIMLRPDTIGFKCFSDDCSNHKFVDLLHLLHEQTGRWPETPIWEEDDLEVLEARWKCEFDDETVAQDSTDEEEEIVELTTPQLKRLASLFTATALRDDEAIAIRKPEKRNEFRTMINDICKTDNYDAMLDYLDRRLPPEDRLGMDIIDLIRKEP
jgi:hypothetical protein